MYVVHTCSSYFISGFCLSILAMLSIFILSGNNLHFQNSQYFIIKINYLNFETTLSLGKIRFSLTLMVL